jgi:oxalate decarboxylase/phosphoglucose isomerase-like protein (cupin superfamily)
MIVERIQYTKKDDRGEITDIMVKENIDYVTLITSTKGSTRGNHYHKKTDQWVYILEGKIKMLTQMPDGPVILTMLQKGDLAKTGFMERHAMIALEDSSFMVFTRGPRGGDDYETDTYRLSEPLSDPS